MSNNHRCPFNNNLHKPRRRRRRSGAKLTKRWRTSYSVSGTPTNLLIDSSRKVIFRTVGYGKSGEKTLEAEVRELLGLDPFETTRTTLTDAK